MFVEVQNLAVVGGAAICIGQNGVRFGEERKVVGSIGVGAICIGVVGFRERIERSTSKSISHQSLEILKSNRYSYFLISAGEASGDTFSRS